MEEKKKRKGRKEGRREKKLKEKCFYLGGSIPTPVPGGKKSFVYKDSFFVCLFFCHLEQYPRHVEFPRLGI